MKIFYNLNKLKNFLLHAWFNLEIWLNPRLREQIALDRSVNIDCLYLRHLTDDEKILLCLTLPYRDHRRGLIGSALDLSTLQNEEYQAIVVLDGADELVRKVSTLVNNSIKETRHL